MTRDQVHAADALTGLLMPFWQLVIGAFVLVILVAAAYRLAQRGPSRMSFALLLTGGAIVFLTVAGVLLQEV
jgi:zinc transporter ZupT